MPAAYVGVRDLHVGAVVLSITLFVVRAAWRQRAPQRLQQKWVRIVPHVIDTVLLLSGIWLAWQLGAAGVRGWLPAKLVALVLYVVLGTVALKRGRTSAVRLAAAVAAVATFAYIASVAVTKSPWSVFAVTQAPVDGSGVQPGLPSGLALMSDGAYASAYRANPIDQLTPAAMTVAR
jgi:uncharacterized membrane protein SirB2